MLQRADKKRPKIVVVGSINYDFTAYVEAFPTDEQTVFANRNQAGLGGKGLNQAISASRMDGIVHMIGCVGNDHLGKLAIAHLQKNHVETEHVRHVSGQTTGVAHILVDERSTYNIVVSAGANLCLEKKDIDRAEKLIASADILVSQMELADSIIKYAFEIAKKHGVKTLLHPSPARPSVLNILPLCDFITPTEEQTKVLTGRMPFGTNDTQAAFDKFMRYGATNILINRRHKGTSIMSRGEKIFWPPYTAKAVDKTGSDDIFNGVLAVGIGGGLSIEESVDQAMACAALSVELKSANAAPTRDEVEIFINRKRA